MKELHLTKLKTVKAMKPVALLFFLFFAICSNAAVTPEPTVPTIDLRKFKMKEIEKMTGKKLGFFQKIKLKILLTAAKKFKDGEMTEKQKKQATASMILGIGSIVLMLISSIPIIGFLGILCIPAAILALVFGIKSLKGNSNTKGIIGVVTGSVTLVLIALAVILLAILFAGFSVG